MVTFIYQIHIHLIIRKEDENKLEKRKQGNMYLCGCRHVSCVCINRVRTQTKEGEKDRRA